MDNLIAVHSTYRRLEGGTERYVRDGEGGIWKVEGASRERTLGWFIELHPHPTAAEVTVSATEIGK